MQERHVNRSLYFEELAHTSKKYYIPYLKNIFPINENTEVLEIGCGDGGNLLPFAEIGCSVTGVDLAETRIKQAKQFFEEKKANGNFIASDIFKLTHLNKKFDVILIHDVIEHIEQKKEFLNVVRLFLKPNGIVFIGFPAWQMPFGGHQQICKSKLLSHWPFVHLLPASLYKAIAKSLKENELTIKELLSIKKCKTTIEEFEKLLKGCEYQILNRTLYFINPHYETKFGLKPRLLLPVVSKIPYFRNYLSTSCFYVLQ